MEKGIPLLNVLINCISARSAPQIMSTKDKYTFRFLNLLITDLCNSSADSSLDLISFLIAPLETDLSTSEVDFLSQHF